MINAHTLSYKATSEVQLIGTFGLRKVMFSTEHFSREQQETVLMAAVEWNDWLLMASVALILALASCVTWIR